MTAFTLIGKNLTRKLWRTLLLMVSVAVAFLVFGVLMSLNEGFNMRGETKSRLVTVSKIGTNNPLPVSYYGAIASTPGVAEAAYASRLRGYYREPRDVVGVNAVPLQAYAAAYADDFVISEDLLNKIRSTRAGAIVGRMLARRMNWTPGDHITITSQASPRKDGSPNWEFEIVGIFEGQRPTVDTGFMIVNYEYFNEARLNDRDTVGGFVLTLAGDASADEVRRDIDTRFRNSAAQTRTGSESEINRAFAAQFANVSLIVTVVLAVAFATILLIVGNTMAFAVRERTTEIGILKACGFPSSRIGSLIVFEMLFICLGGGLAGLAASSAFVTVFSDELRLLVPSITLSPHVIAQAIALMVLLTVLTTAAPLRHALRLKVVHALGRV